MARTLAFSKRAQADLDRIEAFIGAESVGRAEIIIGELKDRLRLLCAFPELGVSVGGGFRQLIVRVRKWAVYAVRYRVAGDVILITRIWHGKESRPR